MTEPQQQPQSSDDSSGESRHVAAQPQYGQRIEPEYGARADEFPPNYNPYVYGGQPEQPAPQAQPSPSQPASVFGAGPAPAQGVPLPMRLRLRVGPTKAVPDGSLPDISTASTSTTRSRTLFTGIGISTPYSRSSSPWCPRSRCCPR